MAFVALALGKQTSGTLVYVNTANDAEIVASLIYDGLEGEEFPEDEELADLSEFCEKMIHPKFQLVHLVKRGVAFHYGNMPSLLREEIERLFTSGKIRFLVSTSTLIEGVNLACRTIIIRGPKKGVGRVMSPQDFWNLAGRAGCAIRLIPATESGSIRPSIPVYCGHRIRLIAASLWTTVINLSG
ncbi:helicase-related protein [Hoeflea sp.]|uniref:helicase-related protein n=1 Tax=Hoeflea sp. TaxID=1940281 RepID=UPI003B02AC55